MGAVALRCPAPSMYSSQPRDCLTQAICSPKNVCDLRYVMFLHTVPYLSASFRQNRLFRSRGDGFTGDMFPPPSLFLDPTSSPDSYVKRRVALTFASYKRCHICTAE